MKQCYALYILLCSNGLGIISIVDMNKERDIFLDVLWNVKQFYSIAKENYKTSELWSTLALHCWPWILAETYQINLCRFVYLLHIFPQTRSLFFPISNALSKIMNCDYKAHTKMCYIVNEKSQQNI